MPCTRWLELVHAYRVLLEDRRYRRLWGSLLLVILADEFVRTLLIWHVYAATGSSAAVGWLMVCFTGPVIVGGLVAGWLLDRFPRARVMASDAALRTIALVLTGVALAAGVGGLVPLYVIATVQGALTMVLLGGAPAAVAELVRPETRSAANALEMLGFMGAAAVGPLLAGVLAERVPIAGALVLAALCYAAFGLSIRTMSIGGGGRGAGATPIRWRDSGVLQPTVAIITEMFLIVNIGSGAVAVFLPVLVDQGLGRGGGTYGMLLAVIGVGGAIGALAAGAVTATARLPAAVAVMQILGGLAIMPAALLLASGHLTVGSTVACMFVFGVVTGPHTVWAQTIRMRFIPPQWRGRAFATLRMIMQSGRPIGGGIGGLAVAAAPVSLCMIVAGAVICLPAILALFHPAMNRRLPEIRDTPA